jgi:hypothetical protein
MAYLFRFRPWDPLTLLGIIAVIYLIVRRLLAIALAIASPFTSWNFLAAHNGFLTRSLLGASLTFLERRPMLLALFMAPLTKLATGQIGPIILKMRSLRVLRPEPRSPSRISRERLDALRLAEG